MSHQGIRVILPHKPGEVVPQSVILRKAIEMIGDDPAFAGRRRALERQLDAIEHPSRHFKFIESSFRPSAPIRRHGIKPALYDPDDVATRARLEDESAVTIASAATVAVAADKAAAIKARNEKIAAGVRASWERRRKAAGIAKD